MVFPPVQLYLRRPRAVVCTCIAAAAALRSVQFLYGVHTLYIAGLCMNVQCEATHTQLVIFLACVNIMQVLILTAR